jgi:hypothetical protein
MIDDGERPYASGLPTGDSQTQRGSSIIPLLVV